MADSTRTRPRGELWKAGTGTGGGRVRAGARGGCGHSGPHVGRQGQGPPVYYNRTSQYYPSMRVGQGPNQEPRMPPSGASAAVAVACPPSPGCRACRVHADRTRSGPGNRMTRAEPIGTGPGFNPEGAAAGDRRAPAVAASSAQVPDRSRGELAVETRPDQQRSTPTEPREPGRLPRRRARPGRDSRATSPPSFSMASVTACREDRDVPEGRGSCSSTCTRPALRCSPSGRSRRSIVCSSRAMMRRGAASRAVRRVLIMVVGVPRRLPASAAGLAVATRWVWPDSDRRLVRDLSIAEHVLDEYRGCRHVLNSSRGSTAAPSSPPSRSRSVAGPLDANEARRRSPRSRPGARRDRAEATRPRTARGSRPCPASSEFQLLEDARRVRRHLARPGPRGGPRPRRRHRPARPGGTGTLPALPRATTTSGSTGSTMPRRRSPFAKATSPRGLLALVTPWRKTAARPTRGPSGT